MTRHQLEIRVTDDGGRPVGTAAVFLTPEAHGESRQAEFDEGRQAYYFDGLRPGFYALAVESPPLLKHEERVQVHPKPTRVDCTLLPAGTKHTFRGATRVPYDSEPDLLGVIPAPAAGVEEDERGQSLYGLLESLGLVPVRVVAEDEGTEESAESERERAELKQERGAPPAGLVVRRTRNSEEDEDEGGENELSVLRRSRLIEAAGPLFRLYGDSFSVFTNRLMVLFYPEVNRDEVKRLLMELRLSLLRPTDFVPNQFLVEADPSIGEAINDIAAQLMESTLVASAEPSIAEVPEEDAIVPRDYLWPAGWDRKHVGLEEAWQRLRDSFGRAGQFGSPEVILAVVDNGIKSVGGMPENEDFHGTVSDGSYKIYKLYDFRGPTPPRPDNDIKVNSKNPGHGLACAGVAAGRADNMSADPEVGVGLAGAAPNVRLMGLTRPAYENERLRMYLWAAGIDSAGRPHNYPRPISPGADILTCSLGFGEGSPLSAAARGMLDHITRRGRNGKGCLAFFSAGNSARAVNKPGEWWRPYGAYERSFSCAASTLDAQGDEVHAPYSGFGEEVDWCAPSSTAVPAEHKPPHSYGVLTATFVGKGDIPSFPDFTTILTQPAGAGDRLIYVHKADGLSFSTHILVDEPGVNGSERAEVLGKYLAAPGWGVDVTPLVNDHAGTAEVAAGRNNHRTNFAGTSSATPLCAGIAALVLSANPDLTWVEVREILRATAEKIDAYNTDPTGRWLNEKGDPWLTHGGSPVCSHWYGYGRLNADAAVDAALAYDCPRDLMLRGAVNDDGLTETVPGLNSPDVWVRNTDPAFDVVVITLDADTPGPHEDPRADSARWIYARVRNRGIEPSYDAWVRFYVASSDGTPFIYPQDWEEKNGQSNYRPGDWEPGAYFIGEVALDSIPPGGSYVASLPWPDGLLPPDFTPAGRPWNPHILVEVTPHDGPLKGQFVHQNNNLAQRSVVIIR